LIEASSEAKPDAFNKSLQSRAQLIYYALLLVAVEAILAKTRANYGKI